MCSCNHSLPLNEGCKHYTNEQKYKYSIIIWNNFQDENNYFYYVEKDQALPDTDNKGEYKLDYKSFKEIKNTGRIKMTEYEEE